MMNNDDQSTNSKSQRLAAVIAAFLQANDRGDSTNVDTVIAANPDISDSLRDFFVAHQQIQRLTPGQQADQLSNQVSPCREESTIKPTLPMQLQSSRREALFAESPCVDHSSPTNVFGDYEILQEVGRGGMGVVYKARQRELDRIVALKMIRSAHLAGTDEVRRFHAEAAAVAQLDHPGIVPIYDVGKLEGVDYFSMAFVTGGSLTDKVADGPLSPRLSAEYVMKIADAVAYAHFRGVIHRDLKPGNVLIDSNGDPRVVDFGLAKQLGVDSDLTATGQVLGTPAYMAPEQAAGSLQGASASVDVYSLGAILYHLIAGSAPFIADNPIDIVLQVLDRDPDPPSSRNRNVPPILEKICRRAMEKNPTSRYLSATALADDLRCFLKDEPISWPQQSLFERFRHYWRREPILIAHWIAIAAVMVISWTHKFLMNTELSYLMWHSLTLSVWAALCVVFQKAMNHARWRDVACVAWGALDVILFTFTLHGVESPRGPLLVGYPVLIASSGLFIRLRYVNMMTGACLIGYVTLLYLHPAEMLIKPQYAWIFVSCLVVLGALVGFLVKRVRTLREYYEGSDRDVTTLPGQVGRMRFLRTSNPKAHPRSRS